MLDHVADHVADDLVDHIVDDLVDHIVDHIVDDLVDHIVDDDHVDDVDDRAGVQHDDHRGDGHDTQHRGAVHGGGRRVGGGSELPDQFAVARHGPEHHPGTRDGVVLGGGRPCPARRRPPPSGDRAAALAGRAVSRRWGTMVDTRVRAE